MSKMGWTATQVAAVGSVLLLAACGSGTDDGSGADGSSVDGLQGCADGVSSGEDCIDDWGARLCPVDSGWPGDNLALCGPKNDDGFLFHYGPANYDDPDELAKYVLEAGGEDEMCVYVEVGNETDVFVGDYHGRMRPGSHHLIITVVEDPSPDLELNEPFPCSQRDAAGQRWLTGSQDPQVDVSAGGAVNVEPPEPGDPEYGAATKIPANAVLLLDLHYLNPTDDDILREAWVWMERIPDDEVEVQVDLITWFQGSINVPPGATGVETGIARCRAPTDRNIGLLTGHFHENGTRFTVWHEPQGQEMYKVYETFNWDSPGNANYADRIENPSMEDIGAGQWGASSGYLEVKAGDYLNFQCEFDNPTDEPVGLGDQGRDQMCNVFGFYYPTDGNVWSCQCLGGFCL